MKTEQEIKERITVNQEVISRWEIRLQVADDGEVVNAVSNVISKLEKENKILEWVLSTKEDEKWQL